MIDDKCGAVKPDEILQCMRDSADDCGTYFDPPEGCSDVINNYADWVESKFIEEEKDEESGRFEWHFLFQVSFLKDKRNFNLAKFNVIFTKQTTVCIELTGCT
jgi:hypothetical protein